MQTGRIDPTLFTADAQSYFDPRTLSEFQSTLAPMGAVTAASRTFNGLRGGMTVSQYRVSFSNGAALIVSTLLMPNGKIEQLLIVGKAKD